MKKFKEFLEDKVKELEKYASTKHSEIQEEYRGQHTAPDSESGSPMHDLTKNGTYPKDVYSSKGLQYYGGGELGGTAYSLILSVKNRPNAKVKIYRAVPEIFSNEEKIFQLEKGKKYFLKTGRPPEKFNRNDFYDWASNEIERLQDEPEQEIKKLKINEGDWVTIVRKYAVDHGKSALNGEYKILSKTVPAKTLFTNGDSFLEWGYHPTVN